jgi:hypothetical protein
MESAIAFKWNKVDGEPTIEGYNAEVAYYNGDDLKQHRHI